MGMFDFFKKSKKENEIQLFSPFEGIVVPLEKVPDEAFAQRMIGDGIAILPTSDVVKNALEKTIDIFKTGHAFTYEVGEIEIIVHIGIETVGLKGEGFNVLVESEKQYTLDTDIIKIDRAFIESKGLSLISPIVIPTMNIISSFEILVKEDEKVTYGQPLIKIHY